MKNIKTDFLCILHEIREKEKSLRERKKIKEFDWLLENKKITEGILGYKIKKYEKIR